MAERRNVPAAGSRPKWPYPRFAAHRGAGTLAPENTLAAMRAGFANGYRMVEFDVKLSGDGVAFLLHDSTLERTTDATGRADRLDWRALSQLDAGSWHSPAYAGEPIPTLASVARWALAHDVACNIEIKPTQGRERETGAAVALDALALWAEATVPPVLSSFSTEALGAAMEAVPQLPRAHLFEALPRNWGTLLRRLGCIALDCDFRCLAPEVIAEAHRQGWAVMTYTPNDPDDAARLVGWGVDCLITDAIDRIRP